MTALLQVSDPHFGTERPAVVEALVCLAQAQKPDVVVLSGDITQRATIRQFAAARAFCDRLGAGALLAIPGNHDIPLFDLRRRLLDPYRRHRAAFGVELEPEWESPQMRIVTVNTTRPWRHKNGEVSARQIDRVAVRVATAAPDQLRIVVVHQPLAVYREEDRHDLLRGHANAARRWAAAGADLVLGGHIHLPYILGLHERDPTLSRPLWVVQAGTAVSSRVRHEAGNSVNIVRRLPGDPPGTCCVERWDWRAASGAFELAEAAELAGGQRPARARAIFGTSGGPP
ncbi:MAG TPA: metallophosphoesterase [Ideonella sp.]|uniref:metallophosphoesterase family protein n=1 Tax=Ideonella sp. TaxID=1929293 RepID=UPI002E333944|nr:metallophosphoesterase [Ideonella sp.]HEX5684312.1 metallophosphoesterase [Ideonella sp.]